MKLGMFFAVITLVGLSGCAIEPVDSQPVDENCQVKTQGAPDGINRDDLLCVMWREVRPKVRACYNAELRNDLFDGRFVSTFEIARAGKAETIALDPDPKKPEFTNCIKTAIAGTQYPTHTAAQSVKVKWPWVFRRY